jgi:hypothetical protein
MALPNQKSEKATGYSTVTTTSDPRSGLAEIREFTDSSNTVFGICWKGQRPEIKMAGFLGPLYSDLYRKNFNQAPRKRGQRFIIVKTADFVLKSSIHDRSRRGCAYDPHLVPAGVNPDDIK